MTRRLGVGVARRLRLGVVLLCALCMAAIACASTTQVVRIARVAGSASTTSTDAIQVDDRTRTWEQIVPRSKLPGSAPIIVVLSGINATVSQEISRDKLVPYVNAGEAELVYPAGFDESWNAGGCCGKAAQDNIDDVAFLKVLVAQVDPGHRHPVDLVGYSNGGRLAYRMACSDAGLFDETAVVKAMPQPGCVVNQPLTILQIDSTNDPAVPYQPGDPGRETPAATTEVARLHATDACTLPPATQTRGSMQLTTWSDCQNGARLGFAVYQGGGHLFPQPSGATPGAASVIWAFFTKSSIPRAT
jgi:polyhydroxybutyrate depolymerase